MTELWVILGGLLLICQIIGAIFAVDAVLYGKTPQGTLAWALGLVLLPYLTVPLYLVFGGRRFEGYVRARRKRRGGIANFTVELGRTLEPYQAEFRPHSPGDRAIKKLVSTPCTRANAAELLIDGQDFFPALWSAIDSARRDLLVQFYIIKDDATGRQFQSRLLAASARGVNVRLLYDAIGSSKLPRSYVEALRDGGVQVAEFRSFRGPRTHLQVNFRNHRKLVVTDARTAIIGGLNIGDEYNHLDRHLTPWRDTGVLLRGPSVVECQLAFAEDWHHSTGQVLPLQWDAVPAAPESAGTTTATPGHPNRSSADARVVIAPTGPADELPTGALMVLHLIASASRRLWIATPYFVPDASIVEGLQLAALRGVDVRIITPRNNDNRFVKLAMLSFEPDILPSGVRMFDHQPGFMHQKVILSDDAAAVGSLNLDNRSMRINFELTALIADAPFVAAVERMLASDLASSREVTLGSLRRRSLAVRIAARIARLAAPVL